MPINGTLLWIWSFLVTLDVQGALVKYETIRCNHDINNMDMPAMWITHHYNHWKTDMKGWIRRTFLVFVPKFDIWVRDPPNFHNNFSFFGTKKLFQGRFCCDRPQKTQVIPHRPLIWWPRLLRKMIQGWSNGCNGALVGMTSQNPGPPGSLAW